MAGRASTGGCRGGGGFRVVGAGALGRAADVIATGVGRAAVVVIGRIGAGRGCIADVGTVAGVRATQRAVAASGCRAGCAEVLVEVAVAAGRASIGTARAWIAFDCAAAAALVDVDGTVVFQGIARLGQLIFIVDIHSDHQRTAAYGIWIGGGVVAVRFVRFMAEQRFEEVRDLGFVMRTIHRDVGSGGVGRIVGMDIGALGTNGVNLFARYAPRHQIAAGAVGVGQRCERCYQCMSHDPPHVVLNNRVVSALHLSRWRRPCADAGRVCRGFNGAHEYWVGAHRHSSAWRISGRRRAVQSLRGGLRGD